MKPNVPGSAGPIVGKLDHRGGPMTTVCNWLADTRTGVVETPMPVLSDHTLFQAPPSRSRFLPFLLTTAPRQISHRTPMH
jgi:hypothetical protein